MGRNAVALVMLGAAVSASSPVLVARADTPLVDAVKRHDRAAVERLLTDGADVDAAQPDGATALHWAVHLDDAPVVDDGTTPLMLAAGLGR